MTRSWWCGTSGRDAAARVGSVTWSMHNADGKSEQCLSYNLWRWTPSLLSRQSPSLPVTPVSPSRRLGRVSVA